MRFKTFGPFAISAELEHKSKELASQFNAAKERLNDASGVYVFAERIQSALVPIYVGKAQRQSFGSRIAQQLNGPRFAEVLDDRARALSLFLIARVDGSDELLFAKVDADDEFSVIGELEHSLIGSCAAMNSELLNLHTLKHSDTAHVPGYVGSAADTWDTSARDLARMLRTKT